MTVTFKVFKKSSGNNKVTVYLGRRDFVDHVTGSDPVDGVLAIDHDVFLNDKKILVQLVCSFRYGREDDETMGMCFKKELILGECNVFPPSGQQDADKTRLQDRLIQKIGKHAYPFKLEFPKHSPTSVILQPSEQDSGEPCGVEYFVRGQMVEEADKGGRSVVNIAIRKIQFAPISQGRQPCTVVRKDFMFSPGELELEATLDRQLYHHGDDVKVSFCVKNNSSKTVKKMAVTVVQCIDIAMFTGGHHTARITQIETTEGCPIAPGSTLNREVTLRPTHKSNVRPGVALDGRVKGDDTGLASSTLLADENNRDVFGLVISYTVKVKLYLGAIGGELSAELPFVLMHPKPNMRKIVKADTLAEVENFQDSMDDPNQDLPTDNYPHPLHSGEGLELSSLTNRGHGKRHQL